MPDPVLVELLRRGNLSVVRSTVTNRVGLLRDGSARVVGEVMFDDVQWFDGDGWRWLLICAAPVALRELAAIEVEAEGAGRPPAQATLAIDA